MFTMQPHLAALLSHAHHRPGTGVLTRTGVDKKGTASHKMNRWNAH
jgi:hypothetical protein